MCKIDWIADLDLLSRFIMGLGVVFCVLCVAELEWEEADSWFFLCASPDSLAYHPWTIITYMFCHSTFIHFIVNALVLAMVGALFLEFYSEVQFMGLYIITGVIVAGLFILVSNLTGETGVYLCGASGGIMALTMAFCATAPNYLVHLTLIGYVKFKWIALFIFITSLLGFFMGNWAGTMTHIYGAIVGVAFVYVRKLWDVDITAWAEKITLMLRKNGKADMHIIWGWGDKGRTKKANLNIAMASRLEEILYKVKTRGYDSLTREEREYLDNNK